MQLAKDWYLRCFALLRLIRTTLIVQQGCQIIHAVRAAKVSAHHRRSAARNRRRLRHWSISHCASFAGVAADSAAAEIGVSRHSEIELNH